MKPLEGGEPVRACMRWVLLSIGAMLTLTAGCSDRLVVSQPLPVGADFPQSNEEFVGIVYSLPKTVVAVTGKPYSEPKAAADSGQSRKDPIPCGEVASSAEGCDLAADKPQVYGVTPAILPDRHARFLLKYSPGHLEDDTVTLETDTSGLLKTSSANSTGRQGEILTALAQTATAIMTLGAGGFLALPAESSTLVNFLKPHKVPPPLPCPNPTTTFSVAYELEELVKWQLLPDCTFISIDWEPSRLSKDPMGVSPLSPDQVSDVATATCNFSVCYRTFMPVRVAIFGSKTAPGGNKLVVDHQRLLGSAAFVAVDPELTAGLNLQSAPLVTRKHTVSFSSGVLTSAMIDDPSVALAVAKLPLTIITALLQGPASVLSMKVTNVQDAASLATQQKALLDAQNALFKDIVASRAQALPVTGSGAGTGP